MLETKKNYCLKKPHQPIQSKPHLFGLVWFVFYFKSQPNQIKPHTYLSCGSDDFNVKIEPNRTANTPTSHSAFYTPKFTVDAFCVFPLFSLLRLVLTSPSPFSTPFCLFEIEIKSVLKTIVHLWFIILSEIRMVLRV